MLAAEGAGEASPDGRLQMIGHGKRPSLPWHVRAWGGWGPNRGPTGTRRVAIRPMPSGSLRTATLRWTRNR